MTPEQKQVLVIRALNAGVRVFLNGAEQELGEGFVVGERRTLVANKGLPTEAREVRLLDWGWKLNDFLAACAALSEAHCARLAGLLGDRYVYTVRGAEDGSWTVEEG